LDNSWRIPFLVVLGIFFISYGIFEIKELRNFYQSPSEQIRETAVEDTMDGVAEGATALVLLNEAGEEIASWDLRHQTGLVIGRSSDELTVDVDLSEVENFSFISAEHAVMNRKDGRWYLTDTDSRNGTWLMRAGYQKKLLLTSEEPVSISPGDTILLAEETILAVR
jgi:pSer/pThr/pTyr-binding forkhead associated (FHA) protein